ncbi:YndJ family protein [Lottiidibacillus patelloidae]|nr:YndJ family protein [Lottiidibacillus patelloidae]
MKFSNLLIFQIILFILTMLFTSYPHLLLLSGAQLLFVPIALHLVMAGKKDSFQRFFPLITVIASLSVVCTFIFNEGIWIIIFPSIYLLFTIIVAIYAISRFLHRGFINFEEFAIDLGLMYLAIGGVWFFAYTAELDTGFSALLTWLTAIHFHYSAFLLPIFVGFLGRIYKPKSYVLICSLILISPLVVAIGITYSRTVEVLSVLIYIVAIYSLIAYAFQANFSHTLQKWLVRISFSAIGVTIIFSLFYAFGNYTGNVVIDIYFMLQFHGVVNAIFFGLLGIIGWSLHTPLTKAHLPTFPVSNIRGKMRIGEEVLKEYKSNSSYNGLIDQIAVYEKDVDVATLAPTIKDFYENTKDYRLFAKVKWQLWFMPFAVVYKLFSRFTGQINLPLSRKEIEMTGDIVAINNERDGRSAVRAWVRKIEEEVAFVALYSSHEKDGKTYNNIALPLPWSTMVGILELKQVGENLQLSSKRSIVDSDAGIYLAFGKYLCKLPLEETFLVKEVDSEVLQARHNMWIFGFPFLSIKYDIKKH